MADELTPILTDADLASLIESKLETGGVNQASELREVLHHIRRKLYANGGPSVLPRMLRGEAVPDNAMGNPGDVYVTVPLGVEYQKGKSGWAPTGLIVKGDPGKTPKKGVDYQDGYTPKKGIDYRDGEDGKTPQKGIDYKDGKDGVTPQKGVDYHDGEDGKTPQKGVDYFDGKTPQAGVDYFDGSFISVSDAVPTGGKDSDFHVQLLNGSYSFHTRRAGSWVKVFTSGSALLADLSVLDKHLDADIKLGSWAVARNAFPAAVRNSLTSATQFFTYIAETLRELRKDVDKLLDGTAGSGGTGTGTGGGFGSDIVINDWANSDLVNLFDEANWDATNNFYTGPGLVTAAFHEYIKPATALSKGYVYKTYLIAGKAEAGVIRIAL